MLARTSRSPLKDDLVARRFARLVDVAQEMASVRDIKIDLTDAEAWDDSALIKAYDRATTAYLVRPRAAPRARALARLSPL